MIYHNFRPVFIVLLSGALALTIFGCSETTNTLDTPEYQSEEVTFATVDNLVLHGTMYIPESESKAVGIIIPGSGPVDRDGIVKGAPAGSSPPIYRFWADYLAARSITLFRYDKRFITYPNLDPLLLSQSDQIADIIAAVNYLLSRNDVDPDNIFLIGQSEGGNIAPVAVSQLNNIAGVVIISAPAFAIDTLLVEQLRSNPNIPETEINNVIAAFTQIRSGQFPSGGSIFGAGEAYWREWMLYSEKADSVLEASSAPAFILQGCSDENFPAGTLNKNKTTWQQIAEDNVAHKWMAYPDVTHSILNESTNNLAENVLLDVYGWITNR